MDQIYVEQMLAKLSSAWPGWDPNRRTWADNIAHLDRATAAETCRWLIAHAKKAPTIAEFIETYKITRGKMPDEAPFCARCSGSGWVTDTDHPRHWPGTTQAPENPVTGECMCNVARSCECTVGTAVTADIHRRIAKERERRHAERQHVLDERVPMPAELREARRG